VDLLPLDGLIADWPVLIGHFDSQPLSIAETDSSAINANQVPEVS
jgi:hypothetical protein